MEFRDPSLRRSPPVGFQCGERVEQDDGDDKKGGQVGSVTFYCSCPPNVTDTLSSTTTRSLSQLEFSCRKRSVGVLINEEAKVSDEELETAYETVDPNFFDPGYTLAGATGFQIWAGTRLLLESLTWPNRTDPNHPDHPTLIYWQKRIPNTPPVRVLELGCGIGVLGINLAAAGAHVLLTDLTTLVDNATYPNLVWNRNTAVEDSVVENHHATEDDDQSTTTTSSSAIGPYLDCPDWLQSSGGIPIGKGWAATTALDWTIPIDKQLEPVHYQDLDFIVASDCVWLVSMLDALLDTVASLFDSVAKVNNQKKYPTLLMSFQRRDASEGDDSTTFTTINRVIQSVQDRGWSMECLAWRPVQLDAEDGGNDSFYDTDQQQDTIFPTTDDEKEVFVFAIQSTEGKEMSNI